MNKLFALCLYCLTMIKIISEEYISKHKYFTARKDAYQTASGKIVESYYVVELPDSACATAITEDGHVILVEQYRHPIGQNCVELPGGFVDDNEPIELAIARELLEETGYSFEEIIYLGKTYANPGVLDNATHLFIATGGVKTTTQSLDENEEINILLKSVNEVKAMIANNEIIQAMHELCLVKAFEKLNG
jgi:ADP-ribose pyrophosphatase